MVDSDYRYRAINFVDNKLGQADKADCSSKIEK